MRSRTGCQTCRQRKLKCDEAKPKCGQCRKASRECVPSDGVVFRHQQNASMNGNEEVEDGERGGRLGGFYAYRNTFDDNNVWVEVPKNVYTVRFLHVTDPYNMESTPDIETRETSTTTPSQQPETQGKDNCFPASYDQAPGLEALSTAATSSSFQYQPPASVPAPSPDTNVSLHTSQLNYIFNPTAPEGSMTSTPIDPALRSPSNAQPYENKNQPVTEHEVAFLLRHFSETAGQWMDLYDLGRYFQYHVPIQSVHNPLLRYSACAYAAKQLGRVQGHKGIMGGFTSSQADMELNQNSQVDWFYIAAKYYDRAISLLMEELANTAQREVPVTPITSGNFSPHSNAQSPQTLNPNSNQQHRSRPRNADETIASAAILCVYEFLDHANIEWARHLSGTKSLFDMADNQEMMPVRSPSSPGATSERVKPSRARRATFWNFARQDFLAAFINEGRTRLNTEDLTLWRAAGLKIDQQGFIMPSNTDDSQFPDRQNVMLEDMISNALVWLMSKITNFIALGDSVNHVFPQQSGSPTALIGITQMTLLERWTALEKELDIWYQGLPETFKPCARLPPIVEGKVPADHPRAMFSEIWYSMAACASAMQAYHMARIVLLMNKPHEAAARRSSVSNRLNSYRSIEIEVRFHAQEICGIALGRPDGSVRVDAVQPLFVAGQVLADNRERHVLLGFLKDIESDLGWATDYRVKRLVKDWGWTTEPP